MVDVQIDNGSYTRIHNAILEQIAMSKLSPLEFKVVIFIIRKTYGFQKKTDIISLSQFKSGCNCSKTAIIQAIKNLIQLNVITRKRAGISFEFGLNKYFDTWSQDVFKSRKPGQGEHFKGETSKADDTGKADGNSQADATGTSKANDTKTSKPDATYKRNKETFKESLHKNVFSAISRVCGLDQNLKRGMLNKFAKTLITAGYTDSDVLYFGEWWKQNDWRGKRGDLPTISQLTEKIPQSKQVIQSPPEQEGQQLSYVVINNIRHIYRGSELLRKEPVGVAQ